MRLKPALLLLSLCYAGSAAGLGLGELSVRSYLGQPLHATVKILQADPAVTAECFRLQPSAGGIAPPLRTQLRLETTADATLLHIRTTQSVYDPIAQFVVAFDCGPSLQREYVVLLDPPGQALPPTVDETAPAPTAAPAVAPPPAPPRAAAERPRTRRPPAATPPLATQRPAAPRAPATAAADTPRLVLSGRRMASQSGTAFALKLDTGLLDLDRPRSEALSEVELSDENTALSRKLAHLEAQLVELQQRNAELEARRTAAPVVPPPPPPGRAKWPLVLLGIGLLLGLAALVALLRRRSRQMTHFDLQSDWLPSETMAERDTDLAVGRPAPQPSEPAPVRMPEIAQPAPEETTEVKDDILDQAEVYMAHGHSDLAIHLLQEHLREAPTESPVPWLLLLDLQHRDGDMAGYAATCAECRTHFNVNLSDHPAANQGELGEGLEAYPHLLERLVDVWRTPELDDFFKDLIYDHRGGTRMGFAPAAYREILLLRAIAHDVHAAG